MMSDVEHRLHDYWERRGSVYYVPDVFGRRIVAAYLIKTHPQSLIDVGCGSGELFSSFQQIPRVVAVDWSDSMLNRAQERIERHEYKNIQLAKCDITEPAAEFVLKAVNVRASDLPLPEKPFEIALTRTVLMHIPEVSKDSEKHPWSDACTNLTKLSDDLVLMEYFNPAEDEKLDWHNFHHDYVGMFRTLNYELVDSYDRPDGIHQILFHFRRKSDAPGDPGSPTSDEVRR
jgi:SAM-dependent methyltransferase